MGIKKNLISYTPDTNLLEHIIEAWLEENSTKSQRTGEQYTEHITHFRAYVRSVGHDLFDDPDIIAMLAAEWAAKGRIKETIASATNHQRLTSLSSFFNYARKCNQVSCNPIKQIERLPIFHTEAAKPLPVEEVRTRLQAIDRTELLGLRDYALLVVALTTGRRVSEIASLHWGNIAYSGERVRITWKRCKGGRDHFDELSIGASNALFAYLNRRYTDLSSLPPDVPIWPSNSRNESKGKAIGNQAISDVCLKHLGTSKSNTTRCTFVSAIEKTDEERFGNQATLADMDHYPPSIYLSGLLSDITTSVT
jgi:site-specific recombinase XerD